MNDSDPTANISDADLRETIEKMTSITHAIETVLSDSKAPMSVCMMAISTVFVAGMVDSAVDFDVAMGLLRKMYDLQVSLAAVSPSKNHQH